MTKFTLILFSFRTSGDLSKLKPFLPTEKQYLITKNGKFWSSLQYLTFQVPLLSLDKPLHIQDTQDADFFEQVELETLHIDEMKEILSDRSASNAESLELSASEDIPDMDDFNEPNLLILDDPVSVAN